MPLDANAPGDKSVKRPRGSPGHYGPHHNSLKTHCVRGHPFNEENTYVYKDGRRYCKACDKERVKVRKQRFLERRDKHKRCKDCDELVVPGRRLCQIHLAAQNENAKVYRQANAEKLTLRLKKWRKVRKEAGLCNNCNSKAVPGKAQCAIHLQKTYDKLARLNYKLTQEQVTVIRAIKYCELCGDIFEGTRLQQKAPVLDHNHATGKFRGKIHQKCNIALGMFKDNIELLKQAIQYLERTAD